jgi:hypothetical protein
VQIFKNKYFLILLAVASAAWIFYAITYNRVTKYKDFINFSWLSGKWVMKSAGYTVYEEWDGLSEVVMEGRSATLNATGDTVSREELRILKIDGTYYYLAKPHNKPKPTMFKLSLDSLRKAVFYNATNEFPKWVVYQRKGDSLFATIRDESKKVVFSYAKD